MTLLLCLFPALLFCQIVHGQLTFNYQDVYKRLGEELKLKLSLSENARQNIQEMWIEQPLDHFNNDDRKWKMRYFQNLQYFKTNGPIFVYIGGEAPATQDLLLAGTVFDLTKETGGALFGTEHRYYGQSMPVPVNTADDFKYLHSKQALADIKHLLKTLKQKPEFKNSKVVAVGGSYAGNLAAWSRLLYPDLIHAAYASSAPVLAKLDFYEYMEATGEDFKKHGTNQCYSKITQIFQRYTEALKTEEGRNEIKKQFSICDSDDLTMPDNQYTLFSMLFHPYAEVVQHGSIDSIQNQCNNIQQMVKSMKFTSNTSDIGAGCRSTKFEVWVESIKQNPSYYTWYYQTCNEFGYYQSSNSKNQPFSNKIILDSWLKVCKALYGEKYSKQYISSLVDKTNTAYGGLTPNVKKVVFVNGGLDPWYKLSVLNNLNEDVPSLFSPTTSHCKDLISSGEIPEIINAIKGHIKKWIGFRDGV